MRLKLMLKHYNTRDGLSDAEKALAAADPHWRVALAKKAWCSFTDAQRRLADHGCPESCPAPMVFHWG